MSTVSAQRGPEAVPEAAGDASPDVLDVATRRFSVVGDLQPTSGLEVWRESNEDERRTIVRAIAAEKPDFLAMMGDLVFCGSSSAAWADFDRLCAPLRAARIHALPVLGNHEHWVAQRVALPKFFARFPHLQGRHWYAAAWGPVGLVFLDSNFRWLAPALWREQLAWYRRALDRFEASPGIRAVLVFLHHPPFTNSLVSSDGRHVQKHLVPPFLAASKTRAMFSGHVHSYERFERGGKLFMVTGGGGGPRVALAQGGRRRHSDDVFDGPPVRSFHYLNLSLADEGLEVEALGLEKGGDSFAPMDRFVLPWGASAGAGGEP